MKYVGLFIVGGLIFAEAAVFLGVEIPFLSSVNMKHPSPSTATTIHNSFEESDTSITNTKPAEQSSFSDTKPEPAEIKDISFAENHTVTPSFTDTEPEKDTSPSKPVPTARIPQKELYNFGASHVVNLFCELGDREVAIATGVILNDAGYILTNAHVAYAENPKPCLIRRGSPAQNFAIAERIFIPSDFSGTSLAYANIVRDIAIWKITTFIGNNTLADLSPLEINPLYAPSINSPLSTFSYPAELLGSEAIVRHLHLSFSETIVRAQDAFIIESTQGIGSQKGSSGGIIINPFTGTFAGLIFAINEGESSSITERNLFSLTPLAIDATVRAETGKSLKEFLAGNP
ncbi:MAG: hypothetical protein COU90_02245 [Candidatus Ryanbacteria bacterium CG10_big_fil_rev_8_21_14_0_10_43_42]|uniref:Serine protease n=1 Tax=Candidatus Ryanbacteria bacterium CG10_big_fil_rev_8_21_14_0_10_43_42 TaxID=1974864 RepID=A0A2M8KXI2_9BACT|nr:MAG: hypothetical protein COU90_02245 [Candidatus Ryanbacteria bacterium CG10_big_fil_rev_8_21_14_0_10_43_42]